MDFDSRDQKEILENAISFVVVFAMFIYGGAKPFQFAGATNIDKFVSEMSGMELMWSFYGYSKAFAITIGILEITGGVLILFRKTRILGCLFTSTILINIILQDIFYGVKVGALKAAILYQILILIVLWMNRVKLLSSIKMLFIQPNPQPKTKYFLKIGAAVILFALFRVGEYILTILL